MYIGCDLAGPHVGLVGDLISVSTDEAEVPAVPALQRVLVFLEFVPKAQVQSVPVQAQAVLSVTLQSHDLILLVVVSQQISRL